MYILANLTINGEKNDHFYFSCADYITATWSPEVEINAEVFLGLSGKTYKEKQTSARNVALDFQAFCASEDFEGLSWNEETIICGWFEKVGKRYGLLREFKENALC